MDTKKVVRKYRFKELLRKMSVEDYQTAMKWLPEKLCISQRTWKRWIYLPDHEQIELPLFRLEQLADFFGCTVAELHTEPRKSYQLREMFNNQKIEL